MGNFKSGFTNLQTSSRNLQTDSGCKPSFTWFQPQFPIFILPAPFTANFLYIQMLCGIFTWGPQNLFFFQLGLNFDIRERTLNKILLVNIFSVYHMIHGIWPLSIHENVWPSLKKKIIVTLSVAAVGSLGHTPLKIQNTLEVLKARYC